LITEKTLYYFSGSTNIETLGTIDTGTWEADVISVEFGGTGVSSFAPDCVIMSDSANTNNSSISTKPLITRPITNNSSSATYITTSTNLITANTLGYWNGAYNSSNDSNITHVGTITSGVWSGTLIAIDHGGTGTDTSPTQWGIIYASSTSAYASTGAGTAGDLLSSNGTSAPTWISPASTNSASSIVKRDANGGFSAGSVNLTGLTINLTAAGNYITV